MRRHSRVVLAVGLWLLGCGTSTSTPADLGPEQQDLSSETSLVDSLFTDVSEASETSPESDLPGPETIEVLDASDSEERVDVTPTPWTQQATVVVNDLQFIEVEGARFFALGFHASDGLVWDGIAGPGECDKSTLSGYLDINIEKTHAAASAGANLVYLWGYGDRTQELLDVTPRFKGRFHGQYATVMPPEDDVVPIFYNEYGEVDLDGYSPEKAVEMREDMAAFLAREGKYSLESMPNLPPVDQVGHMAWHPTFRMIGNGDGNGEMLTSEEATDLAQTTNMMIGDSYTYVENRFDWSLPGEAIMAIATGQKGDVGEGYDEWLEADDPDHRSYFSSGWDLAHSLVSRRSPGTVVWMWLQGYAFGDGIARDECEDSGPNDSWASGGFPPFDYLVKDAVSVIAAGATGFIYFGFNSTRWDEANRMIGVFKALSHPEVYEPVLLSPRLELGFDTTYLGEEDDSGLGRAHVLVKWHEPTRTAYLIAANPGAHETTIAVPFPWSLSRAERLNWEAPGFEDSQDVSLEDRTLTVTLARDSGTILRVTPLF